MPGKTIVITGASDGIGASAARQLKELGHHVVVVGRNPEKTRSIATELGADFHLADFADLSQVRSLAAELLESYPRIDVLANNAGGIFSPVRETTVDGFELTFQVNYLAPFLLTQLLLDRLLESRATVVNTSSLANRLYGKVDVDDLNAERFYSPNRAYGNAKLAQIMFTRELQKRYGPRGLSAAAFHPGVVATSFSSSPGTSMEAIYGSKILSKFLTSPQKGANTLVWLSNGVAHIDWPAGEYFTRRRVSSTNRQANDAGLSASLWDRTEELLERG
ncbi:SDR family NAD(P)-dependent oxidoreductase [Paeniglutamicibacter kerguelensis]|uniref:NAD(P)-dependent dehydrogenase (Short-subunit alcohol dehydrogenase family) n=1 Tax=Paeniglutamicibacter kerguelensis TaxID=254788 RepID=A0ABS4XGJ3_9MICC|nr:SDR family NAD(P)-dependent oxidoreductase [Paeniglutamicibacter kerguelensis]MBP2387591.1 NAD(P)-dependent dehydrogenase (short-subunit alcohol dehydrogenase family) [Paeniglutamicibacter kerguelensis]